MDKIRGFINKQFTVWCGLCTEWHQESYDNKQSFERNIRHIGWKYTSKDGWICDRCAKENTNGKHETSIHN